MGSVRSAWILVALASLPLVALTRRGPQPEPPQGQKDMRLGSVSHAFDESQTFEELACKAAGSGELEITAPKLDNDSPGPHLLFILNGAGVPSEGKVVFIG
jgi:hypothetical protein